MKSHQGFDRLSGIYDYLVKLIFGKAIRNAQVDVIKHAPDRKEWLILGGGTGWILEEVIKKYPEVSITYLEASQKMIDRAKRRDISEKVNYVLGSIEEIPSVKNFDIVLTPFFWDMFSTKHAQKMKKSIELKLKKEAIWLLVDFKNTNIWWQQGLMRLMYLFFRITCRIEASELPDFDQIFDQNQHKKLFHDTFYYGMIRSTIYHKLT